MTTMVHVDEQERDNVYRALDAIHAVNKLIRAAVCRDSPIVDSCAFDAIEILTSVARGSLSEALSAKSIDKEGAKDGE